MINDTLSKIGEAISGLYKLHTVRLQAGGTYGDSGAPVLWQQSDGYYLAGLLWGGGTLGDGTPFFSMSQWTYIASDLGLTSVK